MLYPITPYTLPTPPILQSPIIYHPLLSQTICGVDNNNLCKVYATAAVVMEKESAPVLIINMRTPESSVVCLLLVVELNSCPLQRLPEQEQTLILESKEPPPKSPPLAAALPPPLPLPPPPPVEWPSDEGSCDALKASQKVCCLRAATGVVERLKPFRYPPLQQPRMKPWAPVPMGSSSTMAMQLEWSSQKLCGTSAFRRQGCWQLSVKARGSW